MGSKIDPIYRKIWEKADEAERGVGILCSEGAAEKVRQALYITRRLISEAGGRSYDHLKISFSPHSSDILFLVKKTTTEELSEIDIDLSDL